MSLTRRQFAKANAAAIAASVAGMPIATSASNLVTDPQATALKWHKAPCRFCGTWTEWQAGNIQDCKPLHTPGGQVDVVFDWAQTRG